jgi:acyl-CoA thioester hydrolase
MPATPFVIDEYVRWSDVDYAGIIFYGAYVRFFEIAETELFRAAQVPYGEVFDRFGIWLPRAHLACDFEHPARLDDRLRVAAYFTRFGRSSITINFDVVHVGAARLAAAGREVLVCIDRDTMRPVALPGDLRSLLEPYVMSTEAAREALGITRGVPA